MSLLTPNSPSWQSVPKGNAMTRSALDFDVYLAEYHSSGKVYIYAAQNYTVTPKLSHVLSPPSTPHSNPLPEIDAVSSLSWTSDGYAVAVGYRGRGLSVWSVYGSLLTSISETDDIFYGLNGAPGIEYAAKNYAWMKNLELTVWMLGHS